MEVGIVTWGSGKALNTGGGVRECRPKELLESSASGRSGAYEYSGDGSEADELFPSGIGPRGCVVETVGGRTFRHM